MSSRDDPFGDGKTVISRSRPAARPAATKRPDQPLPLREGTVFDPSFGSRAVEGWNKPAALEGEGLVDGARQGWQAFETSARQISYRSGNPLIAAAGPLFILLSQLRRSPPEVEPSVLADHLAKQIDDFELAVTRGTVADSDARVARYALCETVDDIIQTLPNMGPETWLPVGMLSRFFRADAAGAGFFDALNRVLGNPEPHCDLIEFMHTCLALGFEGQYRGVENGAAGLERIRKDVHHVLRYFRSPPQGDLSSEWQPVILQGHRTRRRVPLWAIAAAGCALVAGAFVEVRSTIADEGEAVASEILALTPSTPVSIEHAAFVPVIPDLPAKPVAEAPATPPPPPPPQVDIQLERVRAALAEPIGAGKLTVGTKGAFILIEINNQQLFQPGKASLKPEFDALADVLATAISKERGPTRIVGHTDSDKPGRSSPFKSNYDLSVARAKAVEKLLGLKLSGTAKLEVEGKGEDEPIADNGTSEGKAKNRRVDLMIAREEGA